MFTIYADGKPLYVPSLFNEGYGAFSPKLTVELNKAGSLEYTLPPTNLRYNDVSKLKSIITVFQNGDELFRGRVLHDEKDFYRQKQVYCEGELAFLLDSRQRPYVFDGTVGALFKQYISNHNARVDASKQFTIGTVNVETSGNVHFESDSYNSTLDEVTGNLVDLYGGYIITRSSNGIRYIDYVTDSGEDNSQIIEFGINLLDITEYISAENVFTVLIPVGATLYDADGKEQGKLNIASVNNGKDYIENVDAISLFGRIENIEEWSDIDDASELKKLGEYTLKKNMEASIALTVKAIDLHIVDVNTEQIRLGDWVRVLSIPHGIDKRFQCTKIVYDLINPDQSEYTFGVKSTSLTEKQVNGEKSIQTSTAVVQSAAKAANASASKANATNAQVNTVIAELPTTYVQTSVFEAYKEDNDADLKSITDRLARLEGGTA